MPTTRATLRARLGEAIGFGEYTALTASATGGAGGTTIVDSALGRYPNNYFNGWWGALTLGPTGAGSYEQFEVSDFATSTGTLTLQVAASAQTTSSATYELYQYPPSMMHLAINAAIRQLYPALYNPLRNETLVANDWLQNTDFETGTFTNWTSVGSPTIAANTTRFWHGLQAASIAAGAGSAGRLDQNVFTRANWREWVGRTITFKRWIFTTAASAGRLRLSFDGATTFTNGSYHAGDDEWQGPDTMYVQTTLPANSTSITASCEAAASQTVIFDGGAGAGLFISGVPIYRYTLPTAFLTAPTTLSTPDDPYLPESSFSKFHDWHVERAGETWYLVLHQMLPDGTLMRLQGPGALTEPTTDTAEVEVVTPRTELIVAKAAEVLFTSLASTATGDELAEYNQKAQGWAARTAELLGTHRMPRPPSETDLPWMTTTNAYSR